MDVCYKFKFENGRVDIFDLKFDDDTFALHSSSISTTSEPWMELEFNQCYGCSLSKYQYPLCPVAANLGGIITPFKHDFSYTPVLTHVEFRGRQIEKKGKLRQGLSSMIGLVMATSGCPTLDMLRPMAYLHQPFSDIDETIYRAISGYLLAQYMRQENGQTPYYKAEGLADIYFKINDLNKSFAERLRSFEEDAGINALVILDLFALTGSFSLDDKWRRKIAPLFTSYLE